MLTTLLVAVTLAQPKPTPIDAAAFRDKLLLLTDGSGHYVAVDPEAPYGDTTFSGDGKTFTKLRLEGGGKSGTESWSASMWDPRVRHGGNSPAQLEMKDSGKFYTITCAKKTTNLTAVPAADAKKLLASATFLPPSWSRLPEKLLRDDTGVYYLVDRARTDDIYSDRRDFRVFAGQKGNMKQLPLKDVVDDAQGMILSTKTGNLRLITTTDGKLDGKWIQGKTVTVLVEVPLDNYNTARMVYMDLGPYAGQRLGTPCDDFM